MLLLLAVTLAGGSFLVGMLLLGLSYGRLQNLTRGPAPPDTVESATS